MPLPNIYSNFEYLGAYLDISFIEGGILMDTLTKLEQLWQPKHYEHLLYCLTYCQSYFEDSFDYQGKKGDAIVVDDKVYTQHDILKILADYYTDSSNDYQSSFGDAVYLFFTDLVEEDVDILSELDKEDSA